MLGTLLRAVSVLALVAACGGESSSDDDAEENQATGLTGSFGMDLGGTIQSPTDAAQNTGTLTFRDAYAGLMGPNATTPPCTFGPPATGAGFVQKAGALLTGFTCPLIVSIDDPGSACRAEGTIAVEYCSTSFE